MKDKKELQDEILQESIMDTEEKKQSLGPLKYIIGGFIVLIFITMIIPSYLIKPNPEPTTVMSIDELKIDEIDKSIIYLRPNSTDIRSYGNMINPIVKSSATKIVTSSCDSSNICYAKALFYFVQDNLNYVNERDEYFQTPIEALYTQGGDCDDHVILLSSMMQSIGIPTRFVRIPRHVYIQIYVKDAPSKYQQEDGWINLDPTCKNCEFGKIPYENEKKEKVYVW